MLFSSTVFLFCFLPALCLLYYCIRRGLRQYVLLFASLFFYAWGEPRYLAVMLFICIVNYVAACMVDATTIGVKRRLALASAVVVDLGTLVYFKYFNFFLDNLNRLLPGDNIALRDIVMPIGISFFTFQSLSYVIDVYRRDVAVQRSFLKLTLYISFFPQLIAGPIVKYHDIAKDIDHNDSTLDDVTYGLKRFIIGLGKKVIIANQLALIADPVFDGGFQSVDIATAWLGAVAYSLQLLFDFSGYSDMAIGIGRMFGFHFLENFNYPYISKSITEFWRRWHISLGTWFKEYVYFPLGGNRRGKYRTYVNLLLVFAVTGMWHGANWTFILWGLWHGLFILVERICGIKTARDDVHVVFRHAYTILAFVIGWTLFRANSVNDGIGFIMTMLGLWSPDSVAYDIGYYLTPQNIFALSIALLFCLPIGRWMEQHPFIKENFWGQMFREACILGILVLSISYLAASTYNPFIYFRF